mmetsp:Transcript_157945/g.291159  ORF Transcript_157945/g.291159 Transcript_157945/m.291159 type:complete len:204 (+) Transcript_157945:484-1095(+)
MTHGLMPAASSSSTKQQSQLSTSTFNRSTSSWFCAPPSSAEWCRRRSSESEVTTAERACCGVFQPSCSSTSRRPAKRSRSASKRVSSPSTSTPPWPCSARQLATSVTSNPGRYAIPSSELQDPSLAPRLIKNLRSECSLGFDMMVCSMSETVGAAHHTGRAESAWNLGQVLMKPSSGGYCHLGTRGATGGVCNSFPIKTSIAL